VNYLSLINWLGPLLLAVMLISALRREENFDLVKCLVAAFAAMGADFLMSLATLGLKGALGVTGAILFYLISVPVAITLLLRFITRIPWQGSAIMAVFYMVVSFGYKWAESQI